MITITKYVSSDGTEFLTRKECESYESSLVDKHGRRYIVGDIIKESWNFHGFGYSSGNVTKINESEFVNIDKSFRFIVYDSSIKFNESRVNCQGWPISGYEIEIVDKDYQESVARDSRYMFDKYYKCYFVRQQI